jgi:hypothetical protein
MLINDNLMNRLLLWVVAALLPITAMSAEKKTSEFTGRIERFDPAFDQLVAKDAKFEKLAEGFTWSEGPVWFNGELIFSDRAGKRRVSLEARHVESRSILEAERTADAAGGFSRAGLEWFDA